MCGFQTQKERLDFLKSFAGSAHASYACSQAGLVVGPAIDLNTGYDLLTKAGQDQVWKILVDQKPRMVFVAPPCSAWSRMQNINDQHMVQEKRKQLSPLVRLCADIAAYQNSQGNYYMIENPESSRIWEVSHFQTVIRSCGGNWDTADFCMFGMRDPVSKLPYKKSDSLLHTSPTGIVLPLFRRCSKGQGKPAHAEHERIEESCPGHGSRTKLSQVYPMKFCSSQYATYRNRLR
jgi:hypothetical protein